MSEQTFWDHLDELRSCLVRVVVATLAAGIVAFAFKDALFALILAPQNSSFVTYRVLDQLSAIFGSSGQATNFSIALINTQLADQFIIHIKMAFSVGFLAILPYALYQIFRFVSPALYANERRYSLHVVSFGYIMFMLGVILTYWLIFPLTFRFLGTYQVDARVENLISLQSYIDILLMLCFLMGIMFELPILCWLFAKLGFITANFLRQYRKHAIVIILIVAAIITPTADIFTLTVVSLPIYLLYEVGILVAKSAK